MRGPLLGLLGLLATPALALHSAGCEGMERHRGYSVQSLPAVDMGGGIVAQHTATFDSAGAGPVNVHERTRFEFCATGRAIEVRGDHVPYPDRPPGEVAAIVGDAISSPGPVTLDELRDRIDATAGRGGSIIGATATESCGCALHYPGLRPAEGRP